jgi:hypothetical protein
MARPRTKNWDDLTYGAKQRYKRGGRSEEEGRHIYESGEPAPDPAPSKTQRKQKVKAELDRKTEIEIRPDAAPDQQWADRINAAVRRLDASVEDMKARVFEVGELLDAAQQSLPHGSWGPMVEHKTPLSLRSAERYVRIYNSLSKSPHVASLPPYVGTLDVLASWKPAALEAAVAAKDVTPELERARATELSKEYGPPKPKRRKLVGATAHDRMVAAVTPHLPDEQPAQADDDGFTRMADGSGQVKIGTSRAADQAPDGDEVQVGFVVINDANDRRVVIWLEEGLRLLGDDQFANAFKRHETLCADLRLAFIDHLQPKS